MLVPAFAVSIAHIVEMGAQEQMRWVDTSGGITCVEYLEGWFLISKLPSYTVCKFALSAVAIVEPSIAFRIKVASPRPTGWREVNVEPEANPSPIDRAVAFGDFSKQIGWSETAQFCHFEKCRPFDGLNVETYMHGN